jgi:uncharacterized membrane protein YhaH (DUF805 family)
VAVRVPRLRRRSFWLLKLAVWLVFYAVREGFGLDRADVAGAVWAALALAALGTLCVGRLHDRGRHGAWLGAALVPVAGALWLAFELGLRRGSEGANAWGADPAEV